MFKSSFRSDTLNPVW